MKTVVTGGCGFIGSHLVNALLRDGHEVLIIDNMVRGTLENLKEVAGHKNLRIIEDDISERGEWEKLLKEADWVVHLAALIDILESMEKPRLYFQHIVEGTLNVVEACRDSSVKKLLYLNSGACYGIADSYPTKEDAPPKPQYPYALFKLFGEQMVLHWAQVYGISALSLRIFNLYGPRCGALFGMFMAQRAAGKPLRITGDGTQTRDLTYIDDVVRAIDAALRSDKSGEIYNIGSGTTVPVNRVAELLNLKVEYIPRRKGEMDVTFGDITKARRDLDWEPQVSIEEGVALMLKSIDS